LPSVDWPGGECSYLRAAVSPRRPMTAIGMIPGFASTCHCCWSAKLLARCAGKSCGTWGSGAPPVSEQTDSRCSRRRSDRVSRYPICRPNRDRPFDGASRGFRHRFFCRTARLFCQCSRAAGHSRPPAAGLGLSLVRPGTALPTGTGPRFGGQRHGGHHPGTGNRRLFRHRRQPLPVAAGLKIKPSSLSASKMKKCSPLWGRQTRLITT
jgi:hypothetical protein